MRMTLPILVLLCCAALCVVVSPPARGVEGSAAGPKTAPSAAGSYDFAKERQWWSLQPVKDPPVPQVADKRWPQTSIDCFIAAGYEAHHLHPVPPADKRALIRRATYDLTGLPPTPDEVDGFLSDDAPGAFERVVDRLLASKAYGERWGRHWLDLVRYADTSGCNSDYPVPQAYKYRDWVIDALNRDVPYDDFVRQQIAGDLLPARDDAERRDHVVATGYLAISRRFGSRNSEFHQTIEDTIDNVGKTMLGLSISCARCHDHKFDPIPNSDYYALYGIFASTKYAFPGTEIYRHTKDFVPLGTPEEAKALREWEGKLAELDNRIEKLTQELAPLVARQKAKQIAATQPGARTRPARVAVTTAPSTQPVRTIEMVKLEMAEAKAEVLKLEAKPPAVDKAYAVSEGTAKNARIQRKGDPKDLGDEVPRRFLTVLGGQMLPASETGSGRLELAQWLTDPSNPLTARVMVNRIWQYHFGVGLVKSPNDFGHRGQAPANPALLDHLATQFMRDGWSLKKMHKRIMLSRVYQLASSDDPGDASIDNANDFCWRQNPRRLSAEEIRDTILTLSGTLDTSPAGPHPFPPETEWHYTQHKPFLADYPSNHRSVYLMQSRIRRQAFLSVFDGADTNAATPDRPISTTAIQALFMMNDPWLFEQADQLAVRVGLAFNDDASRIDYAYRLCYGRHPAADEVQAGQTYLREIAAKLKAANTPWDRLTRAALASYVRVLMSSNEFIFLD